MNRRTTKEPAVPVDHPLAPAFAHVRTQIRALEATVARDDDSAAAGKDGLGKYEHGLLRILAQRNGQATSEQALAVLAMRSVKSSAFDGALRSLRADGLIEGSGEDIHVTAAGAAAAGPVSPLPTGPGLVAHWETKLEKCEGAILAAIYYAQPRGSMTLERLAEVTGYSLTSSSFDGSIRELRKLGLVCEGLPLRAAPALYEASR